MKADDESSTKGPAGFALVAHEMHIALDGPLVVLTHPVGESSWTGSRAESVAGVE